MWLPFHIHTELLRAALEEDHVEGEDCRCHGARNAVRGSNRASGDGLSATGRLDQCMAPVARYSLKQGDLLLEEEEER